MLHKQKQAFGREKIRRQTLPERVVHELGQRIVQGDFAGKESLPTEPELSAAGLNVCIHGVFETGITTCATNQVAATIANMDDGNQIMWQLLEHDIVKSPDLVPIDGALPISELPGLGFELDRDAVDAAAAAFRKQR